MKMRLLLASVAVGLAGCGYFLTQKSHQASFTPREYLRLTEGAEGAGEILRRLKGNLETGEINPADFAKMYKAFSSYVPAKILEMDWQQMGPANVGGRTRAILIVDNNTIYAGAVSGGLWKSTDGANTWNQISSFPACPISTIDRAGDGTIYVGTGPSFDPGGSGNGASGFPGAGLFKSTDGENWESVEGTVPNALAPGVWSYIDELTADPTNPDRIWIAMRRGVAYYDRSTNFLYDPQDEGALEGLPSNTECQDIQYSADGTVMIASVGSADVYRSLDGGQNWSPLFANNDATKLPQSGVGRMELSISPSNSNYMYALGATTGGSMAGAWYSTNKGDTWTQGWPGQVDIVDLFGSNNQGIYDNCISVDPSDPTRAIAGGVTLWQFGSDEEPSQIAFNFGFPGFNLYVHSDIHEFQWAPNGDLYIGTDGGIFKSVDSGQTFIEANNGYITTQFYGIAFTPADGAMGGTQDNGTIFIPNDNSLFNNMNGTSIFGGDGFDCDVSQVTANGVGVAFVTSQNGVLARFDESGSGGSFYDDDILDLTDEDGTIGGFYTTIKLHENTEDELSQQYIIVVNPFGHDTTSTAETPIVLTLSTNNLDIPFQYTIPAGTTLEFFEEIIRPEFFADAPQTEDLNYFWLDPQVSEEIVTLALDSNVIGTETIEIVNFDTTYVYWEDTIIINEIEYIIIDSTEVVYPVDTTYEDVNVYEYFSSTDTTYFHYADTISNEPGRLLVQDQFTSLFAIGFSGSLGLWITRQALDFNTTPDWWKVVPAVNGEVKCLEFDADGDNLYYGTWGGRIYRISNLSQLWSEDDVANLTNTEIFNSGGATVTGISVDPNDPDHLVITLGGYGGNGKVRECLNATAANPTFTNKWNPDGNEFDGMPCYDVVIDVNDADVWIVGTEFGIWGTDDGGDTWAPANGGDMDACPVFDVRQQTISSRRFTNTNNYGVVYAGSHGRGIFRSSSVVSTNDFASQDNTLINQILVYPNPAVSEVRIDVDMKGFGDVNMNIYSINGKLIKNMNRRNVANGKQTFVIPVEDFANGNYIIHVSAPGVEKTGKFVVYH